MDSSQFRRQQDDASDHAKEQYLCRQALAAKAFLSSFPVDRRADLGPGYVLKLGRMIVRSWYYFRMGYATYLTFLFGYVSTLVTVYYLAIRNMPDLAYVFPKFGEFALIATVIGVPLSVIIGWLHLKRTQVWTAEVDIGVEANPYNYKITPGFWKEVFTPMFLEMLKHNRKILASNNLLSSEDQQRISDLEQKLEILISGGYVGQPRRKWAENP